MKQFNLLLLIACFFSLRSHAQSVPAYVPTNGLVGWWPFNGNANDESGNGNNGTVNGATLTSDRFGNGNSAYSFDGISNYINCTDIDLIDSATITTWLSINQYTPGASLIDKNDDQQNNCGYGLYYNQGNGVYAHVGWSGNPNNNANSYFNINLISWHHVVWTYNLGVSKIYIDGNIVLMNVAVKFSRL